MTTEKPITIKNLSFQSQKYQMVTIELSDLA